MKASVIRRLAIAEDRVSRWPPPEPKFINWLIPLGLDRVDLRPLPECVAQRAVERALYNTSTPFWPTDLPEMWPLLAGFREWFNQRYPGRWDELTPPFPQEMPDGSWRSREGKGAGREWEGGR